MVCTGLERTDNPKGEDYIIKRSILQWWDVEGKVLRKTLTFYRNHVFAIGISPNGKLLATLHPTEIKLWDARTGRQSHSLKTAATAFSFSPDGKTLATAGKPIKRKTPTAEPSQSIVRLWSTEDWKIQRTLINDHHGSNIPKDDYFFEINSLAFAQNGNTLIAATMYSLWQWDTKNGTVKKSLFAPSSNILTTPNGKTVAIMSEEHVGPNFTNYLYGLWDAITLKPQHPLFSKQQKQSVDKGETDPTPANALAFSPYSQTVAVGFGDAFLGIYDVHTGKLNEIISEKEQHYSTALGFSPNGRLLARGNYNQTIELWRINLD